MTNKIIFFDIDGTLLNDKMELPKSTFESIKLLQERGHFVVIATGRPPFAFQDLRDKLGITTHISLNGQYVVHQNQVIYKNPLNYHELKKLVHLSTEQKHPLIYVNGDGWETNVEQHLQMEEAIASMKVDTEVIFNPNSYKENEKYQALIFCNEIEEAEYKKTFHKFDFVRWHDFSVDVLPKGGSKAAGIKLLMDNLSLDYEHAYAFGDGLNDREMLKFIPNSVAMGNAVNATKSAAKYVTGDVNNDGIYLGLKQVGLI